MSAALCPLQAHHMLPDPIQIKANCFFLRGKLIFIYFFNTLLQDFYQTISLCSHLQNNTQRGGKEEREEGKGGGKEEKRNKTYIFAPFIFKILKMFQKLHSQTESY